MSQGGNGSGGPVTGRLREALQNLSGAVLERAKSKVSDRLGGVTDRLTDYASGGDGAGKKAVATGMEKLQEGKSPVKAMVGAGVAGGKEQVKQAFGGGGGDDRVEDLKVTNIYETVDVGAPVSLVYNQWTEFESFPSFMKKVEDVGQDEDGKLTWKAQVLWSHRTWQSTIIEQVPDERIVWQSEADKGTVDGTVTFHELTPDLTKIVLLMEYHPKGFVEQTGNIWRSPGRRTRLELKHFVRHVMTRTILDPEQVRGWRGEIRDGEVVKDDETARREEQEAEEGRREEVPEEQVAEERGGEERGPNGRRPEEKAREEEGREEKARKEQGREEPDGKEKASEDRLREEQASDTF